VAEVIAGQVASGDHAITGVILESNLAAGRQEPGERSRLVYGQSVTDACMDFSTTTAVLRILAGAVRQRRRASRPEPSGE
jgi:3-deoxy-7-phosphoheptulonate synthase